jgi:hypothetical protein
MRSDAIRCLREPACAGAGAVLGCCSAEPMRRDTVASRQPARHHDYPPALRRRGSAADRWRVGDASPLRSLPGADGGSGRRSILQPATGRPCRTVRRGYHSRQTRTSRGRCSRIRHARSRCPGTPAHVTHAPPARSIQPRGRCVRGRRVLPRARPLPRGTTPRITREAVVDPECCACL